MKSSIGLKWKKSKEYLQTGVVRNPTLLLMKDKRLHNGIVKQSAKLYKFFSLCLFINAEPQNDQQFFCKDVVFM